MAIDKTALFEKVQEMLTSKGFNIEKSDAARPWGGFFVIDESQAQEFANEYFGGLDVQELRISGKLSPKILIVAPDKRLSWQYHHRRAEIWRVIQGNVGVMVSDTDEESVVSTLKEGETIRLRQGQRHRLIGLDGFGILAEIWQHTDANNPSDEDDIVRVQDDFGR
ncbi:cupin domain-containing protein [Sphingobacterium sp. ML3W]|jgi:mannose-6-phosphate isomerase-like protein (cupin superfamily)|uniref:Cupin domain-containing protein n=2 Tax=Sphingobacteriaceae TaxID=84566 RepID=A0A363NKK3_9SPHI|nr:MULTISPECIES: cupin domain-containing protein [Sphingobacterium]MDR2273603.1 phosphoheptose isomerase [Sphingobacterium sp.]PUV21349.1 cupin domain-containing protein [Sphingobacterium athyrii]QIH36182.1 cupin domain-containing protein [Sphingobacterium sp. DR205]WFA78980.1 cupin domain-containing protein [Sphingobacterium sp. ML3W]